MVANKRSDMNRLNIERLEPRLVLAGKGIAAALLSAAVMVLRRRELVTAEEA